MTSIAVARQYVHSFVGMFTNGAQSLPPLTVHWESSDLRLVNSNANLNRNEMLRARNQNRNNVPVGVPHEVSGESGAFWMGQAFGETIASYYHEPLRLENMARYATSGQPYVV